MSDMAQRTFLPFLLSVKNVSESSGSLYSNEKREKKLASVEFVIPVDHLVLKLSGALECLPLLFRLLQSHLDENEETADGEETRTYRGDLHFSLPDFAIAFEIVEQGFLLHVVQDFRHLEVLGLFGQVLMKFGDAQLIVTGREHLLFGVFVDRLLLVDALFDVHQCLQLALQFILPSIQGLSHSSDLSLEKNQFDVLLVDLVQVLFVLDLQLIEVHFVQCLSHLFLLSQLSLETNDLSLQARRTIPELVDQRLATFQPFVKVPIDLLADQFVRSLVERGVLVLQEIRDGQLEVGQFHVHPLDVGLEEKTSEWTKGVELATNLELIDLLLVAGLPSILLVLHLFVLRADDVQLLFHGQLNAEVALGTARLRAFPRQTVVPTGSRGIGEILRGARRCGRLRGRNCRRRSSEGHRFGLLPFQIGLEESILEG